MSLTLPTFGKVIRSLSAGIHRKLGVSVETENEQRPTNMKNRNMATDSAECFHIGCADGCRFAREEADYEELAAIVRTHGIPGNWDIFRAEILNRFLENSSFDFRTYEVGFSRACMEFFEKI